MSPGLSGQTKKPGNEHILCLDIPFVCSHYLPLPDHMHGFVALNCSPCRRVRTKPQAGLDPSLHEAMILFHHVVHVSAGPVFAFLWQQAILF